MYKEHLEVLSAMPEEDDLDFAADYNSAASVSSKILDEDEKEETITASPSKSDPFATTQFSAKTIQGAYERSFIDEED